MVSSIAYSLGFGSGIDTATLIDDLANASRQPKIEALQTRVQANQAKISALATLTSSIDNFASSLAEVVSEGSFRTQPTVSDTSIMTAKLSGSGGNIGSLSARMTVHALAAGQTLYSGVQASSTDPIGQGAMTLSVGGTDYAIAIDGTNDSLEGLAAAINASGSGVTANIVSDGGGYRLVTKGATGTANAFTLTADAGADPNLSNFTWDGATGMTLGQAATDAVVEVDGMTLTRGKNTIDDIIPGISLTLVKADPSKSVVLGAERQSTNIKSTLNDFMSVYNTVLGTLNSSRNQFGSEFGLRQFERGFNGLTTQKLTSHATINKLSDIGIYTNRDGTIALDSKRFETAFAADPDAVEALLRPPTGPGVDAAANPGISGVMTTLKKSMVDDNGALDAIKDRLTEVSKQYEKDLDRIETREDNYRARLEKQFSGMDARISALKATQSYLEQQIQIWNGNNS